MNKLIKTIMYLLIIVIVGALGYLTFTLASKIYADMSNYSERVKKSYGYTKITTPLSADTAKDICIKFQLKPDDSRCVENAVVYAPDFYKDIQRYFYDLPNELATFETVQEKLGEYLIRCSEPDNDGYYNCRYDIRGDGIYPIGIFFDKENYYYQIFANTGGS
jgi:hypothetical protein